MGRLKKIKIGWLIPYSGIFRNLKSDLQQGLDTALKKEGAGICIESYPEFIQSGAIKETEEALKKLLLYEQVDLVIGVTSSKTARGIIPLLESHHTPALFLNLGADSPNRQLSSDYLFYNSLHLWKSEWVMGKWMQEKYGGEPSINMSIYESGYSLHDSFRVGTSFSGAETVKINVIRNIPAAPDTLPLVRYIQEQQPKHTHILLSGKEGEQFLQLSQEHLLSLNMGISVNPFMVEDGSSSKAASLFELYNASTWTQNLDTADNRNFVRNYQNSWEQSPTVFSLLAYEAGLVLAAALDNPIGKRNRESLTMSLGQVHPIGPRGALSVSTRPLQTDLPVYIRKPELSSRTGELKNSVIETTAGIEWDDPSFYVEKAFSTGWQNPYLCV